MRGTFAVYVEPGIVLTPELIRNRRKELNLTQAKFSARVGVSVETDSRWERGRLVPKKKNRLKIVEVQRMPELKTPGRPKIIEPSRTAVRCFIRPSVKRSNWWLTLSLKIR